MRKHAFITPLTALVAGVAGFFLRQKELATVFNSSGLAMSGAKVTVTLLSLSAAVFVAFIILVAVLVGTHRAKDEYTQAFAPAGGLSYLAVFLVVGVAVLTADILSMMEFRAAGSWSLFELLFTVLAALSAVSLVLLAIAAYRGRSGGSLYVFSIFPPLFICMWLMLLYKEHAADPVLLNYGYECIALASAALSLYFSAGFVFKKKRPGLFLITSLLAIYFCTVVLADNIGTPYAVFYGAIILSLLVSSTHFIRNLENKSA